MAGLPLMIGIILVVMAATAFGGALLNGLLRSALAAMGIAITLPQLAALAGLIAGLARPDSQIEHAAAKGEVAKSQLAGLLVALGTIIVGAGAGKAIKYSQSLKAARDAVQEEVLNAARTIPTGAEELVGQLALAPVLPFRIRDTARSLSMNIPLGGTGAAKTVFLAVQDAQGQSSWVRIEASSAKELAELLTKVDSFLPQGTKPIQIEGIATATRILSIDPTNPKNTFFFNELSPATMAGVFEQAPFAANNAGGADAAPEEINPAANVISSAPGEFNYFGNVLRDIVGVKKPISGNFYYVLLELRDANDQVAWINLRGESNYGLQAFVDAAKSVLDNPPKGYTLPKNDKGVPELMVVLGNKEWGKTPAYDLNDNTQLSQFLQYDLNKMSTYPFLSNGRTGYNESEGPIRRLFLTEGFGPGRIELWRHYISRTDIVPNGDQRISSEVMSKLIHDFFWQDTIYEGSSRADILAVWADIPGADAQRILLNYYSNRLTPNDCLTETQMYWLKKELNYHVETKK